MKAVQRLSQTPTTTPRLISGAFPNMTHSCPGKGCAGRLNLPKEVGTEL